MDKYPLNVFSRYVEDNKSSLTGIGVIATIAALFLNLDRSVFGDSLQNLQLLLLLFLILGLIFLTIDSLFWFKNNADSLFSGLITFSLGLTTWRIWEFVLANFRDELNQYLLLIFISVTLVIYAFFNNIKKKAESDIDKKFSGALSRAVLYGLLTFLFFYFPDMLLGYYSDFAHSKELSPARFLVPFSNTFVWTFAVWVAVTEFCVSFFFTKERARLWLNVFLLSFLGLSVVVILWPVVQDIFCIFKKC